MPEYPETKRERCRCGGRGIIHIAKKEGIYYYKVQCDVCWMQTFEYQDEAFAVKRWNDVMADKTAKVLYGRTYNMDNGDKVIDPRVVCENCGNKVSNLAFQYTYCPHCGRKLEWKDERQ